MNLVPKMLEGFPETVSRARTPISIGQENPGSAKVSSAKLTTRESSPVGHLATAKHLRKPGLEKNAFYDTFPDEETLFSTRAERPGKYRKLQLPAINVQLQEGKLVETIKLPQFARWGPLVRILREHFQVDDTCPIIRRVLNADGKCIGNWAKIEDTDDWLALGRETAMVGVALRADCTRAGARFVSSIDNSPGNYHSELEGRGKN